MGFYTIIRCMKEAMSILLKKIEETRGPEKVAATQEYCQHILDARKQGVLSDQEAAERITHATIFLNFSALEKEGVSQNTIETLKNIGDMAGDLELSNVRPLSPSETENIWRLIEGFVGGL